MVELLVALGLPFGGLGFLRWVRGILLGLRLRPPCTRSYQGRVTAMSYFLSLTTVFLNNHRVEILIW